MRCRFSCPILFPLVVLIAMLPSVWLAAQESESPEQVVAVVNGRKVTLAEVDRKAGAHLDQLRERIFKLRQAVLHQLIRDILFEQEAMAQGISLGDYKRRLTLEGDVSEADVLELVRKLYPPEVVNNQAYLDQVRAQLERTKKVELLRAKDRELRGAAQVEVYLSPPVPPPAEVETGDREGLGNPNAPVTIVEFGDFQCEHCRAAAPVVREILSRYGNRVRYFYRHLPLGQHEHAWAAAQASECAREEGRFWEYHDLLFENAQLLSRQKFVELAQSLGLEPQAFEQCLATARYRYVVEEDLREARRVGATATPTFFVNGRRFPGTPTVKELEELIQEALKKVGSSPGAEEGQR